VVAYNVEFVEKNALVKTNIHTLLIANRPKEMRLSHAEFLRRFELHILPKRFVKIRHYALLQNHGKKKKAQCNPQTIKTIALAAQGAGTG